MRALPKEATDDEKRINDEIARMKLHGDIERARQVLMQYDEGKAYYHELIEKARYTVGRLDERLGVVE